MIAQVAFDLKLHAVEVVIEFFAFQATTEFLAHGVIGQVGDVADHARQHQAALGDHAHFLERAAVEFRIGEDRLTRDFIERDVLRRQLGRRRDSQAVTHTVRVGDGPLQRLHAAQAAADDGCPLQDAQGVSQTRLAVDPVFDCQDREVGAEGFAGFRVDAARAGGAVAAAEVVQADDEEGVGVDRLAGADTAVPPARLAVFGAVVAGGVVMPGQGVTDQHRVAFGCVELTVGFVDEVVGSQRATAGQSQWLAEMRRLRRD